LDPEGIRELDMGAIWNFAREQGSYSLAQNMGHRWPVIKA